MNLLTWLTVLLIALAALCRPPRARCPSGWWLAAGVRPSGSYACVEDAARACANQLPGRAADSCYAGKPEPARVESQIWCTNGTRPVVVDGETVGCMRGGWTQ